MEKAAEIIDFWFLPRDAEGYLKSRKEWWIKSDTFDQEIKDKFGDIVEEAVAGTLEASWKATPQTALAHIICLDQFTRNIFRGTAKAWAGDERALRCAQEMIQSGQVSSLPQRMQAFAFMPLMHAESLESQDQSVDCFTALAQLDEQVDFVGFAEKHRDVVRLYGRFPSRNVPLGRESSPAELEYVAAGGGF